MQSRLDSSTTIGVVGPNQESFELVIENLRKALSLNRNVGNVEVVTFNTSNGSPRLLVGSQVSKLPYIFVIGSVPDAQKIARVLTHETIFDGNLVIVGAEKSVEWPRVPFENPRPILMYFFPCAGTNRVRPSFNKLFELLGWRIQEFAPFRNNSWVLLRNRDSAGQMSFEQADADEAIRWHLRCQDTLSYVMVHDPFNPQVMEGSDVSIAVLMRDPRDIINSFFRHVRAEFPLMSDEELLLHLLHGYYRSFRDQLNYCLRWPSIQEIVTNYLWAIRNPQVIMMRFEDIHVDSPRVLRDVLFRLGLYPNPFVNLSDKVFEDAAKLGSFEHQSGGTMIRGADQTSFVGVLRKGVIGDWKNSFTPRVVAEFKRLTGDGLIQLGYETDPNWNV